MKMFKEELEGMEREELLSYVLSNGFYRKDKVVSRDSEVLELLEKGSMSIFEISEVLGISGKNVSSILCGLKKKGVVIWTDENGKKVLQNV